MAGMAIIKTAILLASFAPPSGGRMAEATLVCKRLLGFLSSQFATKWHMASCIDAGEKQA